MKTKKVKQVGKAWVLYQPPYCGQGYPFERALPRNKGPDPDVAIMEQAQDTIKNSGSPLGLVGSGWGSFLGLAEAWA